MSEQDNFSQSLLIEVRNDVKDIKSEINEIKILDAIQNAQLAEHMRRTALSEEQVKLLSAQLEPIKTHVTKVQGALQIMGAFAALSAFILAILQIYKLIN